MSDKEDHNCIVCCRESKIFSVGPCDHPVCFECSTRMRVLCSKNECPICRKELRKVAFTRKLAPYEKEFKNKRFVLYEKQFGIGFEDEGIWDAFDHLLQYRCPICDSKRRKTSFNSFHALRRHVQKEHERFFCDLCVDTLKVFNHERKCYTREELTEHRRRGDPDDTSHRGHPLCKFCDQRFVDNDELFRHVRRDHFFCHFCDADESADRAGRNVVFSDYGYLRDHFLAEHFLCEEGSCQEERFINAFRTELDLKAHKMKEHLGQASKAIAKQTRTLELEFSVARTGNGSRGDFDGGGGGGGRRCEDRGGGGRRRTGQRNVEEGEARFREEFEALGAVGGPERNGARNLDTQNVADFPSLSAATGGPVDINPEARIRGPTQMTIAQPSRRQGPESTYLGRAAKNMMREEDFPSLNSTVPKSVPSPAPATAPSTTGSVNITISRQGGSRSGRPSGGVSVEYSRSVTVPITVPHSASATVPQARVTRISSSQNIRLESPVGMDATPVVVSQANVPTLQSIGESIGSWGAVVAGAQGAVGSKRGGAAGSGRGPLTANGKDSFPALGPPEKPLPSLSFAAKTQKKAADVSKPAWGRQGAPQDGGSGNKKQSRQQKQQQPTDPSRNASPSAATLDLETKKSTGSLVLSKSKPNADALDAVRPAQQRAADSDFPSLSFASRVAPTPARRLPPPPGFEHAAGGKKDGRGGRNNAPAPSASALPSPTEMTFTNSSGQRFDLNSWEYHKPRNFEERCEELTRRIRVDALRGDADRFDDFAAVSAGYLTGGASGREYYARCGFYFADEFRGIFPEFLALLPDIGKQGDLLAAHQEHERERDGRSHAVDEDFFNCPACKQVLLARDYEDHADYHGEEDNFPKLG